MRRLLKIELSWAFSRAFTKFGIAIAASKPMMATTIMISTRVKPAVLFVLICMTLLSVFLFRGVNDAKGGLLLLLQLFTNCLLQPRLWSQQSGCHSQLFQNHNQLSVTNWGGRWTQKEQFNPRKSAARAQKEELGCSNAPPWLRSGAPSTHRQAVG